MHTLEIANARIVHITHLLRHRYPLPLRPPFATRDFVFGRGARRSGKGRLRCEARAFLPHSFIMKGDTWWKVLAVVVRLQDLCLEIGRD
jgi:hypothetical protein